VVSARSTKLVDTKSNKVFKLLYTKTHLDDKEMDIYGYDSSEFYCKFVHTVDNYHRNTKYIKNANYVQTLFLPSGQNRRKSSL